MTQTPGPYRIVNEDNWGGDLGIRSSDDLVAMVLTSHVGLINAEANAAFIVKACNCHNNMLEALELLQKQADCMNNQHHAGISLMPEDWSELYRYCNVAREALRKARGKE